MRIGSKPWSGQALATFALLIAFAALAAAVEAGDADTIDIRIRTLVHASSSTRLTDLMLAVTAAGSVAVLGALFVAAIAGFYFSRRRDDARLLAWTMGGAIVLENALKLAFERARPEPFFGLAAPETYSFPSGHALFSACFYGTIAWRLAARPQRPMARVALWAMAAALVAAIGYSRIYLGVHLPSDVLAGYLVAAFWVSAIAMRESLRAERPDPTSATT